MSKLTKDTLMSVYPSVLEKDKLFNALGQMTAETLGEAFLNTKNASIYTRIYELSEEVLDILAKDFGISWYDYNFSVETKRRVIAAAFSVHIHLGTVGAMNTALSAIWPNSKVEEWFEYGGDPYYFRVLLAVSSDDNEGEPISYDTIMRTINLYKNERSWLEDVPIVLRIICDIVIRTSEAESKYYPPVSGTMRCGPSFDSLI